MAQHVQQRHGPVVVLHTGGGNDHTEEQPEGIDEDMALAALDLLPRIIAADPPLSVVLTDWLSMMPALGWRCLPVAARTSPRSRSCMSCQVPSWRHCRK
jgi:hypothetical protein